MLNKPAFYASKPWQQARHATILRDNNACRICGCSLRTGRTHRRAAVVDHIEPLELSPDKATDPNNLWAVCKYHHDTTCQSIERKHGNDADAIRQAKLAFRPVGLDGYPMAQSNPMQST